jgi:hypothetical protein
MNRDVWVSEVYNSHSLEGESPRGCPGTPPPSVVQLIAPARTLHHERSMIRIIHWDERWADIEVIDGRLRVVSYHKAPQSMWRLLAFVRQLIGMAICSPTRRFTTPCPTVCRARGTDRVLGTLFSSPDMWAGHFFGLWAFLSFDGCWISGIFRVRDVSPGQKEWGLGQGKKGPVLDIRNRPVSLRTTRVCASARATLPILAGWGG